MPTFYKPGTRRDNKGYVVRERVCGIDRELRTPFTNKASAAKAWAAVRADYEAEAATVGGIERRPESATVADAIALYRQGREIGKDWNRLLVKIDEYLGDRLLAKLTVPDIHIAARVMYPHAKPQTQTGQVIVPLRAVLHHAAEAGMCPYMRIRGFRAIGVQRPVTMPTDGLAVAATCPEPLASVVYVLTMTGWRIGEVLMLRREWFDLDACTVRRWVSKSREWQVTAILPEVAARIAEQPVQPDGRVFRYRSRWTVYQALNRAGVDYRPHQSRRGLATALHEGGASAREIADAGGWRHTATVQRYIGTREMHVRTTLEKLRGEI